jgi:hypothetical protein
MTFDMSSIEAACDMFICRFFEDRIKDIANPRLLPAFAIWPCILSRAVTQNVRVHTHAHTYTHPSTPLPHTDPHKNTHKHTLTELANARSHPYPPCRDPPISNSVSLRNPKYSPCTYVTIFPSAICHKSSRRSASTDDLRQSGIDLYSFALNTISEPVLIFSTHSTKLFVNSLAHQLCVLMALCSFCRSHHFSCRRLHPVGC